MSTAGHCWDISGNASSLLVIRSTVMAKAVTWSRRGKKPFGRLVPGLVAGGAGAWPSEQFAKHGIRYEPSTLTKSQLYAAALPRLNSGLVELVDSPRLRAQFCGLERRVHRGGKDSIDHASGAHDDLANVCAGLIATCTTSKGYSLAIWQAAFGDGDPPPDGEAAARERARRMHPQPPLSRPADAARWGAETPDQP